MNERYHKAIEEAIGELRQLSEQEHKLRVKRDKLLNLIAANVNMLPDHEQAKLRMRLEEVTPMPTGLSDAILRVLPYGKSMSAVDVRDALINGGYNLSDQSNPLASIHTTLKRLAEAGKVMHDDTGEKSMYMRTMQVSPPPGVKDRR